MIKRFTPLALLFGLLTALLLGGTATAQANPLPNYKCSNGAPVGVVVCVEDVSKQVTVTIKGTRALTDNELRILEKSLNNVQVNVNPDIYIQDIKLVVVDVYKSFNPPIIITVADVTVCIVFYCK